MTQRWAIVGTDTGVGKTLVTASLLAALRAEGTAALALKPIESGCQRVGDTLLGEDGLLFAHTAQCAPERTGLVRLEAPLSPSLAARREGREIGIAPLLAWIDAQTQDQSILLIESAGGLMSPINDTQTGLDLTLAIHPTHILLVSRNRLGTLSQVLTHARVLEQAGHPITAAILTPGAGLTETADVEASNLEELRRFLAPVLLCSRIAPVCTETLVQAGSALLHALRSLPHFRQV